MTGTDGDRAYRWTWFSLTLYPLAVAAAFAVGEGLATLYGHGPESEGSAPWWVVLGAGLPALLVLAAPVLVSVRLGRRAVAGGRPTARLPMYLGIGLVVAFVLLNLASYAVGLLSG